MKNDNYRAVYNTEKSKAVCYDFEAKYDTGDKNAIEFIKNKFSVKDVVLINFNTCETIFIGNSEMCDKIYDYYLKREEASINSEEERIAFEMENWK